MNNCGLGSCLQTCRKLSLWGATNCYVKAKSWAAKKRWKLYDVTIVLWESTPTMMLRKAHARMSLDNPLHVRLLQKHITSPFYQQRNSLLSHSTWEKKRIRFWTQMVEKMSFKIRVKSHNDSVYFYFVWGWIYKISRNFLGKRQKVLGGK
jgi:hypothetical protein